jgi:rubrerythrin
MNPAINRHVEKSGKIDISDINWTRAAEVGLTEDERFVLTYFSDVERQTLVYLRSFLAFPFALEPEISAFLSTWAYEEYCHGYALARLMSEAGHPLEDNRLGDVRAKANLNETFEFLLGPIVSRIFSDEFAAVYTTFGAMQELTTLRGYENLQRISGNEALVTLSTRIAKQERKHFAWYFNTAKERLQDSPRAQWLTRLVMEVFWFPVGAGIKTPQEVRRLFGLLFPGAAGDKLIEEIDGKIGSLPGLEGLDLMHRHFKGDRGVRSTLRVAFS